VSWIEDGINERLPSARDERILAALAGSRRTHHGSGPKLGQILAPAVVGVYVAMRLPLAQVALLAAVLGVAGAGIDSLLARRRKEREREHPTTDDVSLFVAVTPEHFLIGRWAKPEDLPHLTAAVFARDCVHVTYGERRTLGIRSYFTLELTFCDGTPTEKLFVAANRKPMEAFKAAAA
jgi:hypothetical protein